MANVKICDCAKTENNKKQKKKLTNLVLYLCVCLEFNLHVDEDKAYIDVDYMNRNTSVCLLRGSIK